jgi:hypothetical protein
MKDEMRGRRTAAREEVQHTPRPGGRVAGQRIEPAAGAARIAGGRTAAGRGVATAGRTAGGARGARRSADPLAPVQGTAALRLEAARQVVAEPAGAPRLRVAPPAPVRVPRARFVAFVVAVVVAGVFGILLINTKTNENTFELSRLQDRLTVLDNQQQQLDRELDVASSAGNLDAAAKRRGLVKSGTPAYIRLPDGKVLLDSKPGEGQQSRAYQQSGGREATQDQGAGR